MDLVFLVDSHSLCDCYCPCVRLLRGDRWLRREVSPFPRATDLVSKQQSGNLLPWKQNRPADDLGRDGKES